MALPVSNKWKEAIKGQFRYPGYLRVVLTVAPPGMREGAVATTDFTEAITDKKWMTDGNDDPKEPVATFERNRWRGDGSQYLASTKQALNRSLEWWSNTVHFDEQHPITIRLDFDVPYSIPGLYISWDTETDSWPTDWVVEGFNVYGASIGTYHITNTKSSEEYTPAEFNDIKAMELTINKWSKEHWRVRINEIVFGLYLRMDNDMITNADFSASAPLTAEDLPTFTLSFVINNYDKSFDPKLRVGYSKYLAQRQQVKVQWGFEVAYGEVEWMDSWPMYLNAWAVPSDNPQVSMEACSRNDFITNDYILGLYDGQPHNFYDLAEHILENSGIIHEEDLEIPWELTTALRNFSTRAPVPIAAANANLQLIANACCCIYDTNPINGFVRIRNSVVNTDYEVTTMQQLGDPAYEILDRLKSIKVGVHSFSPKPEPQEVYKTELELSGATILEARFNSGYIVNSPQVSATNATVSVVATYARAMILRVTPTNKSVDVVITITGIVVEESTTMIQTYNDPEVANGLEIEVDNELITEMAVVHYITDYLVAYYKRRNHLSVPYLGYPELELGDRLAVPTTYGQSDGDIVGLKLTFNGGFDGTLSVVAKE